MKTYTINKNGISYILELHNNVWCAPDHELTQKFLEMMFRYKAQIWKANVLDIGCGTGVLSIFASKLGAEYVLSIDVEENAVKCTETNAKINNIRNVEVAQKDFRDGFNNKIDIILANLPCTIQAENLRTISNNMTDESLLFITWEHCPFTIRPLYEYATQYEIIDKIEGIDYDCYVLKIKKKVR